MCIICVLWEQDKLTSGEVVRAAREQIIHDVIDQETMDHLQDLIKKAKEEDDCDTA
jgi:hypothetical protein